MDHGRETWVALLERAGFPRDFVFQTQQIYPDELVGRLAETAVLHFSNGSKAEDFVEYFGRCFIRAASHFDFEKIIKVKFADR